MPTALLSSPRLRRPIDMAYPCAEAALKRQTVKSMGAAEFFHKPVNLDELCVALCRVLAA